MKRNRRGEGRMLLRASSTVEEARFWRHLDGWQIEVSGETDEERSYMPELVRLWHTFRAECDGLNRGCRARG